MAPTIPLLPQTIQPPPFKTDYFTTSPDGRKVIAEEWRRFHLSSQTAIQALLNYTQRLGGAAATVNLDDPDAPDPLPLAVFPSQLIQPTLTPSAPLPWFDEGRDEGEGTVIHGQIGVGAIGGPFTPGSVIFVGSGGQLAQDNPNFQWIDASTELAIGGTVPILAAISSKSDQTGTAEFAALGDSSGTPEWAVITRGTGSTFGVGPAGSSNAAGAIEFVCRSTVAMNMAAIAAIPMVFFTGGQAAANERMRIDSTGKVGIGNTSPNDILDITGNFRFSGVILAPDGSGAAASIHFLSDAAGHATGLYKPTTDYLGFAIGGTGAAVCALDGGVISFRIRSDSLFEFSSTTSLTAASDTALARNAAGVVEINNGTAGTFRDLKCRNEVLTGAVTTYNNIATVGGGVPAIYGSGRSTAQTAAVASVAAYAVGAVDGSFWVSANVNVTTSTAHSFTVTCSYTDETNTARVLTLSFAQLAGTLVQTITNVTGAGPYEGIPNHIRAKASTSITIATTGTFTTVTYNCEGSIVQIA